MDPLDRARLATADMERYSQAIVDLRQVRMTALQEALEQGATRVEIARRLEISLARVNQLLGRQYERGSGVKAAKPAVKGAEPAKKAPRRPLKGPEPEGHRHRYVSDGWNHTRGAYLVRQRCECGDTRVVPAPSIPKELKGGPDSSIVAA